ncbi:hypothetical protein PTKIN_Ptkin17bG0105800 [Pterospermum kingtungense]
MLKNNKLFNRVNSGLALPPKIAKQVVVFQPDKKQTGTGETLIVVGLDCSGWVLRPTGNPIIFGFVYGLFHALANSSEGFTELAFEILKTFSEVDIGKFAMVVCNIWRQRNSKLWNDSFQLEAQVVFSALKSLCDWVAAKEKKNGPSFSGNSLASGSLNNIDSSGVWQKPPVTYV